MRIRGVYASASLKLGERFGVLIFLMRIRGVYASASLKRRPARSRHHVQPGHPRCLRLGLIEANLSGSYLFEADLASEVFTPRPH